MEAEAGSFNGSGSAKNMPLLFPHHSKKHRPTVNNLVEIIFHSIYWTLFYNARFAWIQDLTTGH